MIRKFATVLGFRVVLALMFLVTILAGAANVSAQQTPPEPKPAEAAPVQPPADPQSSSQEPSPEESAPRRKTKPHDYKNWSFNVGGGASLTNGNTRNFVRGGGGLERPASPTTTASISAFARISNGTTCPCAVPRCSWRRHRPRQTMCTPSWPIPLLMSL